MLALLTQLKDNDHYCGEALWFPSIINPPGNFHNCQKLVRRWGSPSLDLLPILQTAPKGDSCMTAFILIAAEQKNNNIQILIKTLHSIALQQEQQSSGWLAQHLLIDRSSIFLKWNCYHLLLLLLFFSLFLPYLHHASLPPYCMSVINCWIILNSPGLINRIQHIFLHSFRDKLKNKFKLLVRALAWFIPPPSPSGSP